MRSGLSLSSAVAFLVLTGCGQNEDAGIIDSPQSVFSDIDASDTIRLTGTEPFWGGTISGDTLTYTTPENPDGTAIPVTRFAGNNGLGYNGTMGERTLDLAVTPGACSDGMSDRTYPFTVTLQMGQEQRFGCAWSDGHPFTGPKQP